MPFATPIDSAWRTIGDTLAVIPDSVIAALLASAGSPFVVFARSTLMAFTRRATAGKPFLHSLPQPREEPQRFVLVPLAHISRSARRLLMRS